MQGAKTTRQSINLTNDDDRVRSPWKLPARLPRDDATSVMADVAQTASTACNSGGRKLLRLIDVEIRDTAVVY